MPNNPYCFLLFKKIGGEFLEQNAGPVFRGGVLTNAGRRPGRALVGLAVGRQDQKGRIPAVVCQQA